MKRRPEYHNYSGDDRVKISLSFIVALVALGLVGGALSGLLGIGSGIIMVPILSALWERHPDAQKIAQGTALAVMVPMTIAGALSYHFGGQQTSLRMGVPIVLWCLLLAFVALAVPLRLGTLLATERVLGYVNWNYVAVLAVGAVIGSTWLGAPLAVALPSEWLKKIFGVFMIIVGLRMLGLFTWLGTLFTKSS